MLTELSNNAYLWFFSGKSAHTKGHTHTKFRSFLFQQYDMHEILLNNQSNDYWSGVFSLVGWLHAKVFKPLPAKVDNISGQLLVKVEGLLEKISTRVVSGLFTIFDHFMGFCQIPFVVVRHINSTPHIQAVTLKLAMWLHLTQVYELWWISFSVLKRSKTVRRGTGSYLALEGHARVHTSENYFWMAARRLLSAWNRWWQIFPVFRLVQFVVNYSTMTCVWCCLYMWCQFSLLLTIQRWPAYDAASTCGVNSVCC